MFASWGVFDESFFDDAVLEAEKAVALDENDATALAGLANALIQANRPAEGLNSIEQAMRLDPHHPPSYLITLGAAHFGMEKFEEAAAIFERAVKRNPESEVPLIYLASAYGHLGRVEEADNAIDNANDLRNLAGLTLLWLREAQAWAYDVMFGSGIDFHRFGSRPVQDLLRAGLTDIPSLKWHYLVTVHRALGPYNTSWEVEGATQIDLSTAKSLHEQGAIFIDVSGKPMWNAGHVPGAVHLSWERTDTPRYSKATLKEVAGYDDEIVLYFDDGSVIGSAFEEAAKAVTWGYRKVYHFDGGAKAWKDAGYPVETGQ
jgi:tetratricopeptide (TPR) repeat protein